MAERERVSLCNKEKRKKWKVEGSVANRKGR